MKSIFNRLLFSLLGAMLFCNCQNLPQNEGPLPVGLTPSKAKIATGKYISWREHIIDDTKLSGITGSDGLSIGDLDKDGFIDIVSVHETDTEYTENAEGFIRIAFGTDDPTVWNSITLAEGTEVGGAEDVAIVDLNGDGFLDIVAACEWAHLIYFENPAKDIRNPNWKRLIPSVTKGKGAFIRVFDTDFNLDGKPELIAANKGLSDGLKDTPESQIFPISYFEIKGKPLKDESWIEHELLRVKVPINAQPVDLDGDGDEDVIAGSRGEGRIYFLENTGNPAIEFITHSIKTKGSSLENKEHALVNAFNPDFADFNKDGRKDIVLFEVNEPDQALGTHLIWLEQPADLKEEWQVHAIGNTFPDQLVGVRLADINGDGLLDVMTGGYSRGKRDEDGTVQPDQSLGRMAWFEQPKDISNPWVRHDISRRVRGMFDKFIVRDMDSDGDIDFISTRGNSVPFDGVFWLEQLQTEMPQQSFYQARKSDSSEQFLPE